MYPNTQRVFGHVIEEIDEGMLRVSKHHHTYYLEGAAYSAWKKRYSSAKRRDAVSHFLDKMMIDIGQLPV